jgi:riboflavin synthase
MFTGLIETVGRVESVLGRQGNKLLTVQAGFVPELESGDSVAVNGVCLTVVDTDRADFRVEAVAATLKSTTVDRLRAGDPVNLERALALGDRLGGHMVQGHVDEIGKIRRVTRHSGYWNVAVQVDRRSAGLLVPRGSVAVDGVSLTIADTRPGEFTVNIVPHTWEQTCLRLRRAGAAVNVEYDVLVKAVAQQSGPRPRR